MREIWKDIEGFDGYKISNLGNIYSLKRNCKMSISHNDKGYCYAHIYKNSKQYHLKLHRLVAKTFIPNPNNYLEINHIDGNKSNNCVNNLEWCNRLHNMKDAYKNNLIPPRRPNRTSYKSKQVLQYDLKGNLIKIYNTLHEASKQTGIRFQTLSRYCLNQRSYKDYIWKYANY